MKKSKIIHRLTWLYSIILALLFSYSSGNAQTLSATVISYQQVNLSWQKFSHVNNLIEVQYTFVGIHSQFYTLATVTETASGTQSYQDKSVSGGTKIAYRLKYTVFETGATVPQVRYSNEVTVTTPVAPPRDPSGLTLTDSTATQITLRWTGNQGKDWGASYVVERSSDGGSSFSQIHATAYTELPTISFTDSGLNPGRRYCYRVKARVTAIGDSGFSNTACGYTKAGAPNAPSALIAKANLVFQIQLNWIDGSNNETGFEVERSTDNNSFTKITTTGANVTQFIDGPLTPGTRYYYRVRAINGVGVSGYSDVANDVTVQNPPTAPQFLIAATVSSSQIDLTWRDISDNESGFELERSIDGTNFSKIADIGANTTGYQNTGLNPLTKYWYRIRAKNSGGNSGYSNIADASTLDNVPNIPQNLNGTPVSNSQINLSWTDNSGNETGFELERSVDGTNFSKLTDLPANTTSYQNTGLATLTKYWYRVRSKNAIGNSGYSNTVEVTTFDVPPAAPSTLTAVTTSASQIDLTWKDNSTNETGFQLERSTDGTNFSKVADVAANAVSYTNTGLSPATRYWYRVRAVNSANPSPFSNVADATTKDVAPATPENLTATTINYGQIDLSWLDKSGNEAGFQIERSTNGIDFTKIADAAANITTYQDKSVASETQYYYRIRAMNAIGPSAFSNVATATTPVAPIPDMPRNLQALPVDFDLIQLSWSPLSNNAISVVIERSTSPSQGFVQIGNQAASLIQFPDREILAINDYYYRIKAVNSAGSSAYSDVVKVSASDIITGIEPAATGNLIYAADRILFVKHVSPAMATLRIFDLRGIKVMELPISQSSHTELNGLKTGIYVVTVETEKGLVKQKILIH